VQQQPRAGLQRLVAAANGSGNVQEL